ncbi:hypothetical protein NL676_033755 [Syzygium grande]|nr:hypothetical protein NL676_033755 [Syzygium grande]
MKNSEKLRITKAEKKEPVVSNARCWFSNAMSHHLRAWATSFKANVQRNARNNASISCHDLRWRTTMAGDDISMESSELKRQKMDSDDGRDYPDDDDPRWEDGITEETRRSNKIGTWICFAVRRKVQFLDLNFLGCAGDFPDNLYVLPSIVLRCSCLVELKLASCEVWLVGEVQLTSLRKLFMKQIELTDNIMADILSGCPLLKELSLEDCYGLHEPEFCSAPSIEVLNLEDSLEKLDLTRSDIKHLNIDISGHLELVCPNVKILDIAGRIECVKVTDMSSLVDTSLHFSHYLRCAYGEYREFRLLLEKLSCSPYFMPCDLCILVLTIWELTHQPCPSFAWKHVTLQLHLEKRDEDDSELAEAGWNLAFDYNGFSYWSSVDGTFPCLEHQLKHVKVYGYVLESDVIELIEFLLKNAQVLEKMEISTKKTLQRTRSNNTLGLDTGIGIVFAPLLDTLDVSMSGMSHI